MNRETLLKIVLAVVGVLFLATAYLMIVFIRREPSLAMMMSLYATLGIFLLLAFRNPASHRSLIAFAGWSSLAHASLMAVQAELGMIARSELIGVAVFALIGIVLLALRAPAPVREAAVAG